MTGFEYALGLFSVVIGLALGEVALDLHRLVRRGRGVRWDARVVLSTTLVVVVTVRLWFALWTIRNVGEVLVFPFYLTLFIEMILLFMLGASCLPEEPAEACDLGAFYERNRRSFWSIFALFQTSFCAHWLYFGGLAAPALGWLVVAGPLACYVLLAMVRRPWLHLLVPALLITGELAVHWNSTLGDRMGG